MKTIICLIRHGQTDWNKDNIIQGRLNKQLNDNGIEQAHQTGMLLAKYDSHWDVMISSPLDRAYDTATIIASHINYQKEIIKDFDFIEREFGEAEGCPIEPVIYNRIEHDDVQGMEKTKVLQKRSNDSIQKLAKLYPNQKVLVATHSHFIKGLMTTLLPDFTFTSRIKNSGLNYVVVEDGKIIDCKINVSEENLKQE